MSSSIQFREKACFPYREFKKSLSTSTLSNSSSLYATGGSNRKSRVICNAREAVNEGFCAPWCGACKMIAPVIDELAKEYAGKIACYKLNTDEYCPNIVTQYEIRSIPTVLFLKNGETKESVIDAVPKSGLSVTVEKYV